ncbi:hypothetical protein IG631_05904 [Alternaria alternata]|nr:hypothetical protein IG631_05904 [Alternaria alternata]
MAEAQSYPLSMDVVVNIYRRILKARLHLRWSRCGQLTPHSGGATFRRLAHLHPASWPHRRHGRAMFGICGVTECGCADPACYHRIGRDCTICE